MDISILKCYSDKGLLKSNKHPKYDIYIWNYSEKVQYNKEWDTITLMTRGLVTDFNGNIISRNFSKFFNLEEYQLGYVNKFLNSDPFKDKFKVYDKLDGSLGILFYYNEWIFCTKGSFTSIQSIQGKFILDKKINYDILDKSLTYTFEIIYPENKIVINYDKTEDTIFLSAFDKNGKEKHDIRQQFINLNLSVVKEYPSKDAYLLKNQNIKGKEGYVIVFENGERLKIKFENYIKLHKIVSNLSVKNAFDWFKSDEPIEKILELIPDEYHLWYRDITTKILDECNSIITIVKTDYFKLITLNDNRKIFSLNIKTHPYKTLLFKIYDCHKNFKNLKNLESDNFKTNEFLINDTSIKNTIFNFIQDSEFFKQLQKDNLPIHFK